MLSDSHLATLPMTGGDGPMIVTVVGLSIAGFSMILLLLMKKKSRKPKQKTVNGARPKR